MICRGTGIQFKPHFFHSLFELFTKTLHNGNSTGYLFILYIFLSYLWILETGFTMQG